MSERTSQSATRHVLHIVRETSGEWQAWCCCGWASYTWRLKESARTAAETHAAALDAVRQEEP
jgi:hypothetical protein